ncbi:MAG: protein kinase [Sandaracinaceae bacterium]
MGAPADSDPTLTASQETALPALPAGLGENERAVVAGRYELTRFIAEGGMGAVYIAEHTLSRKKMALKVVHPHLCRGKQGVERFKREVSAAASIDHPGIVQVYDAGRDDDGGFFMAMELLEGESLGDRLRNDWPGMRTAVAMIEGMLEPLAKAHAKNFIHRDLKPDNVFLARTEEGGERVKLLDFGLAREVTKGGPTQTGITFGTPEYMSPEQAISARKVRSPGDVWSVGVMLYELLSGVHPFTGETPNAIMANAIKEPLPPLRDQAPHVPEPLAVLIERCLDKEPEARPQTAGEMLDALRAVVSTLELDDTVPDAPSMLWPDSEDEGVSSHDIAVSSSYLVSRRKSAEAETVGESPAAIPAFQPAASSASAPASDRRRLTVVVWAAVGVLGLVALGVAGLFLSSGDSDAEGGLDAASAEALETTLAQQELETDAPATPTEEPVTAEATTAESEPTPEPEPADAPEPAADVPPTPAASPEATRPRPARVVPRRPPALPEAQACLARGDSRCAREVLEARGRTEPELALLERLYEQTGDVPPRVRTIRRYLRRFPRGPRAATYQAYLRMHGH